MNYYFEATDKGKTTKKCRTHSKRRFLNNLRSIKWRTGVKIYLRVYYGQDINNFGKKVAFFNDGWYENQKDLMLAFEAFAEAGG